MRLDSGMSLQQEVGWSRDVLRMARYVHVIVRVWSEYGQAHNVIVEVWSEYGHFHCQTQGPRPWAVFVRGGVT